MTSPRAEIVVDLGAIRANIRALRDRVRADLMVVVKANAYGHGMVPVARVAREAGAAWLGVATLDEAFELRAAGDTGPILSWLHVPGEDFERAAALGVDVTAYGVGELLAMSADVHGLRVQLKIDSGLSRGGATLAQWPDVVAAALQAQHSGAIEVTGIWSHFANADDPRDPLSQIQADRFSQALAFAHDAGLAPQAIHLANSAGATLRTTDTVCTLARIGIAAYGLDPAPAVSSLGLTPAMTVRTRLAMVKSIGAGEGVSYGHTFIAPRPMQIGLVPIGYAEGVPRHASGRGQVWINDVRCDVLGRVCMDQFIVDVGEAGAAAGDEVIVFGPGTAGEPTAQDWAVASDTINYEIVSRMGGRLTHTYTDSG